ncbi:MAG: hypothetical protein ABIG89_03620 [Candidatus Woesearchaeota archaeon]
MTKTKQKALLLISGGIDSPVAGYMMQKTFGELAKEKALNNEIEIIALHFSLEPFSDNSAELKSKKIAKLLGIKKFITVTNGTQQAELTKKCDHRYYYILQRRLFLRTAERIANEIDKYLNLGNKKSSKEESRKDKEKYIHRSECKYLITGDNLGQVGSQTLKNMEVISKAVDIEILRPILTNDKNDTMKLAREIGTYELSLGPEMCSILGPKNPATTSTLEKIEAEEKKVDIQKMICNSLESIKIEEL